MNSDDPATTTDVTNDFFILNMEIIIFKVKLNLIIY